MASSASPRLLHDSLVFFAQSIKDPSAPKHCAICLLGCNQVIVVNESEPPSTYESDATGSDGLSVGLRAEVLSEESRLSAAGTVYYKAIVSLLAIPRTAQAVSALRANLSECRCSDIATPLISHFHELGRDSVAEWIHKTPDSFLIAALFKQLALQVARASTVRVAKGQGKCWPASVADIIPLGPSPLVTTIGQWIVLLDEPTTPLQFLTAALRLLVSMKAANRRIERGTYRSLDPVPLFQFAVFIHAVMSCRTSKNSIMVWAQGHETKLWTAFSDAVRTMRSLQVDTITPEEHEHVTVQMIDIFRSLIIQFSPAAIQPRHIYPDLVLKASYTTPRPPAHTSAGLMDTVTFLSDLKAQRYCFVLGCPHAFQDVGKRFQKCSVCNVLGYCSPACQAADWKARKFPHKVYCKKIKLFLDAAGGAKLDFDDRESFARRFDRSALPAGDTTLQDIADWSDSRRADVEDWDLVRACNAMH
ncbi:hypothetical protein C8R46DRAFT_1223443 [Mycena filopes]|nr:hypothetical protein C8R46DRAFT_1223443 [Mycena filopes]